MFFIQPPRGVSHSVEAAALPSKNLHICTGGWGLRFAPRCSGIMETELLSFHLFDIRSIFICCLLNVCFFSLGDCVVLETFKMGHGTNFAFSVKESLSFSDSVEQGHGTGSAAWDWVPIPAFLWTSFLTFLRLVFSYVKWGENNWIEFLRINKCLIHVS